MKSVTLRVRRVSRGWLSFAEHCDLSMLALMPATILKPRYLLPIAPDGVQEGAGVAVEDGRIAAVEPFEALDGRFPEAETIELDSHVLMPGLVNAHGHLAMSLMRGLAGSQPLDAWLNEIVWPLERRIVDRDFVADGTGLALAEMIASGTTCASDHYWYPEVAAEAAVRAGFRLQLAVPVVDSPSAGLRDVDECIHRGVELHDRYRDEELIKVAFGPHSCYAVDLKALRTVQTLADEIGADLHMHLHETEAEVAGARARHGISWIRVLSEMGMITPSLQTVHMTQLDDGEIDCIARGGVRVIHCPHSNLLLASGRCRVGDLQRAGVIVGLGTDGAASNNSLDMFQEMRTAMLARKSAAGDAAVAPAAEMLKMATLDGARALGLGDEIGSIEQGKLADLIAVDFRHPALQPVHDVQEHLVHTQAGHHVSHVWVGGRCLYEQGRFKTLDIERVMARAREWPDRMRA